MHFGTFQLTDEGDRRAAAALWSARATQHGVSADAFRVLDFGESVVVTSGLRMPILASSVRG